MGVLPKQISSLEWNMFICQLQLQLFKLSVTQGVHPNFGMISYAPV